MLSEPHKLSKLIWRITNQV